MLKAKYNENMIPALIKLTSKSGNSFRATSPHEYIDAPCSVTMLYCTTSESSTPSLNMSLIHRSVSLHAVPLPKAIIRHLQISYHHSKIRTYFRLTHLCLDIIRAKRSPYIRYFESCVCG